MNLTDEQRKEALDDLRKLNGDPPYDTPSNICCGDGYFANSLVRKWGCGLDELKAASGYNAWKAKERVAYAKYLKEIGVENENHR